MSQQLVGWSSAQAWAAGRKAAEGEREVDACGTDGWNERCDGPATAGAEEE